MRLQSVILSVLLTAEFFTACHDCSQLVFSFILYVEAIEGLRTICVLLNEVWCVFFNVGEVGSTQLSRPLCCWKFVEHLSFSVYKSVLDGWFLLTGLTTSIILVRSSLRNSHSCNCCSIVNQNLKISVYNGICWT